MTKLRNTCLFYIIVFIIAPPVFLGLYSLFNNPIISGIITAVIVIPLLFIERIIRIILRKRNAGKQNFLICPRCNISVEIDPGICPSCKNRL